eukprot:CAMPEP_0175067748 /NCGR_PEP_ID=MMETSP0052_2-20121109/17277_1 /TAXON_ID=51329 ORGANISM="Polytomella parva, Strain SAG 63-3" /NCGR_SAMPLE_ID=MMETSP0052_2 /ASSEMBLY_ACC=CAM_ASM_000194 /LENGTH=75 /DNA_ID=CAMNT_0016334677 /DNA_START=55 /DNA_END=278 /DNA_ORIENTATION=-
MAPSSNAAFSSSFSASSSTPVNNPLGVSEDLRLQEAVTTLASSTITPIEENAIRWRQQRQMMTGMPIAPALPGHA